MLRLLGLCFGTLARLFRSRRRPSVVGEQTLIGREAMVRSSLNPVGYVSLDGESWKARLEDGQAEPEETVQILGRRGLEFQGRLVKPKTAEEETELAGRAAGP